LAVAVALLNVKAAEPVLEDVTVDMVVAIVVEAVFIELVMLPFEVGIDPVDMESVALDASVALVVIPDTEATEEGADTVESIANWPE
jgi:hypothetical protein